MTRQQTQDVIRALGGPVALAAELSAFEGAPSITHPALCQWNRVPARRVLHVEAIAARLGLPYDRYTLRPDIFGVRAGGGRKKAI